MTKRDSSTADLDSPRNLRFDSWSQPMNPYRHRHASEAASSSAADSPSRQGLRLPGTPATPSHYPPPPQFGYSSSAPAIPMPTANQNWHHQGADRDVSTSPGTSYPYIQRSHYIPIRHSSAKIDDHGGWQSRNGTHRQPHFFNGMIGHVRPRGGGYVDSWAEATRLSNYWRRFYNIDQVYEDQSGWYPQEDQSAWHPQDHQYHGSPDNAALGGEDAEISDLADDTSVAVETGQLSVPSQINQLATVLYNVLIADREFNAPILEKIEISPSDPNANPIQVWSASDLSHLSSHLAITASTLAWFFSQFEDLRIWDVFKYIIHYEFRISASHRGRKWWSTIAILTCLEVKGCPRRGSCTERSAKGAEAHGSKTFYMAQVGNGRDSSCQGSFLMFSPEKSRFWPNMFKQVMFKQVTSRTSLTFWTRSRPFSPLVSESLICFQFL